MKICFLLAFLFFGLAVRAQAAAFAYEDLVNLIQTQNLRSLEQVLPLLPNDLRSNYTLMRDSRSLQGATPELPRVILFGGDASLTCAFSDVLSLPGYDSLECIQYRAMERRFDFRQIQFPTRENGLTEVAFSSTNQSADGLTSCSTCHHKDPRPNWDGYNLWRGAYGSADDRVYGPADSEDQLRAFNAKREQNPRYKWLISANDPLAPYLNDFKTASRPNLRFVSLVNRMNAWRDLRLLEAKTSRWQQLAFAVNGMKCPISKDQKSALEKSGLAMDLTVLARQIFAQTGLTANGWTTAVFSDHNPALREPFNFFGGFGLLEIDVGMAVATEEAQSGNLVLQKELQVLQQMRAENSDPVDRGFFDVLNKILIDPTANRNQVPAAICNEMTRLFIEAARARDPKAPPLVR